jgi:hypothetical protein
LVQTANSIIDEYSRQGYTLTLRQLYYQHVARGLIENNLRAYKNLGTLMTDARNCGLVDWYAIEDRGRTPRGYTPWPTVDSVMENLDQAISADYWYDQPCYVEVWVEKDALASVIERATREFHITTLACKGYLSASESWRASMRFRAARSDGKECHLFHLGDHDPSGIDMTRDNESRMSFYWAKGVTVTRLALNMDQVEEYGPPPNPAKISDSRAVGYIERFGDESWELDALEPSVLERLISDAINPLIDWDRWGDARSAAETEAAELRLIIDNIDDVRDFVRERFG